MQPSAVMHATLAYVSLDRDLTVGRTVSVLTTYHRAAAIRHIREMMSASSTDMLEALASAVVLLVSAEVGGSSSTTLHLS